MKKYITAGLMIFCLIIAILYYKNTTQITLPEHTSQETDDQASPSEPEQQETVQLQAIHGEDPVSYSLENDRLNITFDKGENWTTVPIEKNQLFNGNYTDDKQELIDHSYILTKNRAGFLYSQGANETWEGKSVLFTYTVDQGITWKDAVVSEQYSALGFRKVAFINDDFGYVIITGERVVSQEASNIYITNDGGEAWEEIKHPDTMSLVLDGGFIDEMTGFLSVGPINPEKPDLHVTQDAGNTWSEAKVNIPGAYDEIFLIAEMPIIGEDHLEVLVNQGPNGDYKGGKVKGKFISQDNGNTWEFSVEVDPDDAAG